jgi:hypothetical protein
MIKDAKRAHASTTIQEYSCIYWVGGSVRIGTYYSKEKDSAVSRERQKFVGFNALHFLVAT